jgi:hypothetical protein
VNRHLLQCQARYSSIDGLGCDGKANVGDRSISEIVIVLEHSFLSLRQRQNRNGFEIFILHIAQPFDES